MGDEPVLREKRHSLMMKSVIKMKRLSGNTPENSTINQKQQSDRPLFRSKIDPRAVFPPKEIIMIANWIEKNAFDEEGIFRISGIATKMQELQESLELKKPVKLDDYDCHEIASCFKVYFRELEEPLMTWDYYPLFIAIDSTTPDQTRLNAIKGLISALPQGNKCILDFLIGFLNRLSTHSEKTKMSSSNLSIVFGPCLLRPKDANVLQMVQDTTFVNRVVETMIKEYHEIFENKKASVVLQGPEALAEKTHSEPPPASLPNSSSSPNITPSRVSISTSSLSLTPKPEGRRFYTVKSKKEDTHDSTEVESSAIRRSHSGLSMFSSLTPLKDKRKSSGKSNSLQSSQKAIPELSPSNSPSSSPKISRTQDPIHGALETSSTGSDSSPLRTKKSTLPPPRRPSFGTKPVEFSPAITEEEDQQKTDLSDDKTLLQQTIEVMSKIEKEFQIEGQHVNILIPLSKIYLFLHKIISAKISKEIDLKTLSKFQKRSEINLSAEIPQEYSDPKSITHLHELLQKVSTQLKKFLQICKSVLLSTDKSASQSTSEPYGNPESVRGILFNINKTLRFYDETLQS